MRTLGTPWLVALLSAGALLLGCSDDSPGGNDNAADAGVDGRADAAVPNCEMDPPDPELLLPAGPHPEEGTILIGGRLITPAGDLVPLDGFPLNVWLLPSGDHLLVTEAGFYRPHGLWLLDAWTGDVLAAETRPELFYGIAVTADGSHIYLSGGSANRIYVYEFDAANDLLTPGTDIDTGNVFPGGLALTPDEDRILVADNEGREVVAFDRATGLETDRVRVGDQLYDVTVDAPRNQLAASIWGESNVVFVDLSTFEILDTVETGKNPEAMLIGPGGDLLYVVNSDSDTVSVVDLASRTVTDTIELRVWHASLRGISPNHLALSPDGQSLLVSAAGTNSVEVFDLVSLDHVGSIPTAWYPTGITVSPLSDEVFIVNSKGIGAGPSTGQSAKRLMAGNLQIVPMPTDPELASGTDQVVANYKRMKNLEPTLTCSGTPEVFPVPKELYGPTPIEHVMLLVRENKTYDSELGDLDTDADGDPSLVLFDEWMTPNLHALARQFTNLDNYFTNGEVSLQGHHWLTGIMNNDFYEKTVPGSSSGSERSFAGFSGVLEIGWPDGGFIWGYLQDMGIDFVNYGQGDGALAHDMVGLDMDFPGIVYSLADLDVYKASYVIERIEEGYMPHFTFLLLPNNHTEGSTPGKPTPQSMIADNDQATGMIVDAVSRSPFWERTVIFIVEDDALQGGDHVESHRSICLVVSPWAKRSYTSRTHGDIPAVWATIWRLLGVPPLGIYDANAAIMFDAFSATPDYTPYTYLDRNVPEAWNAPNAFGAHESMQMDFSKPDQARGLPRLLWQVMTGVEPPWPARRSGPDLGLD
ncbi:MAG: bifunctional YncE family protein/alkaline phosphatase family protein [bacterium]